MSSGIAYTLRRKTGEGLKKKNKPHEAAIKHFRENLPKDFRRYAYKPLDGYRCLRYDNIKAGDVPRIGTTVSLKGEIVTVIAKDTVRFPLSGRNQNRVNVLFYTVAKDPDTKCAPKWFWDNWDTKKWEEIQQEKKKMKKEKKTLSLGGGLNGSKLMLGGTSPTKVETGRSKVARPVQVEVVRKRVEERRKQQAMAVRKETHEEANMRKYSVEVNMTVFFNKNFSVEANNPKQAEEKVLKAVNELYSAEVSPVAEPEGWVFGSQDFTIVRALAEREELQLSDFEHGYLLAKSYQLADDVTREVNENYGGLQNLSQGFWITYKTVEVGDSVFGYSEYCLSYGVDDNRKLHCTVHPTLDADAIDFSKEKKLW